MMPLRIHNTATSERSPPRFCVAGVESARVRLRDGKDSARLGEMPMPWQITG